MTVKPNLWILGLALLAALLAAPGEAWAQEEKVVVQYIYVPNQDFKAAFGQEPKSVQLSFDKYLELLKKQPAPQEAPLLEIAVRRVDYRAKVVEKSLEIEMDMALTSLTDEVQEFVFPFGMLGIDKATLDGQNAYILAREMAATSRPISRQNEQQRNWQAQSQQVQMQQNVIVPENPAFMEYRFFIQGKGEHKLQFTCHQNLQAKRDELAARLVLGKFPQQVFRLETLPEMEYFTEPMYIQAEDGRELTVYLGSRSELDFRYRPREKKDVKQPVVVVHTYASHLVQLDKVASQFRIYLEVFHRPQKTFELDIPMELEIVNISEKRWELQELKAENKKRLILQVEKEVLGQHTVTLKGEAQLLGDAAFTLPSVVATGSLSRQDGLVYVEKSADIRLELNDTKEVRQINPHTLTVADEFIPTKGKRKERPQDLVSFGQEPFLAFQYWNPGHAIQLTKKAILPLMESTFVSALSLYPDGLENASHVTFDILEGKIKQLEIGLPADWNLSRVETMVMKSGMGNFQLLPPTPYYVKANVLYLPLPEKVSQGERVKISLFLQTVPDKWNTAWKESTIALPLIRPLKAKYLPSFMGIITDPDYELKLERAKSVSSVDLSIIKNLKISSTNLSLGLKSIAEDAQGVLEIKRKEPYTVLTAATYFAVQPEKLKCAIILAFDIKNASRDTFQFSMPLWFQQLLHVSDEFGWIKEKRYSTTDKGNFWDIQLQKRVMGKYSLFLSYDVPIEAIKKQQNRYTIPPLTVADIAQLKGFLGIGGSSQAEITLPDSKEWEKEGLEMIPATQLPIFAHPEFPLGTDFLSAFKYTRSHYQFTLKVLVHDKVEVASAIIEDSNITTLIPESGLERVTCTYQISHLGLQFFPIVLPPKSDFWSAVVDNQGEKPLHQGKYIAIPLPQHNDRRANSVQIVYERKISPLQSVGSLQLERPQPDPTLPVKRLNWYVYLPPQYQYGREFRSLSQNDLPWYEQLGLALGTFWAASQDKHWSGQTQNAPEPQYNEASPVTQPSTINRPASGQNLDNVMDDSEVDRDGDDSKLRQDKVSKDRAPRTRAEDYKRQLESPKSVRPTLPQKTAPALSKAPEPLVRPPAPDTRRGYLKDATGEKKRAKGRLQAQSKENVQEKIVGKQEAQKPAGATIEEEAQEQPPQSEIAMADESAPADQLVANDLEGAEEEDREKLKEEKKSREQDNRPSEIAGNVKRDAKDTDEWGNKEANTNDFPSTVPPTSQPVVVVDGLRKQKAKLALDKAKATGLRSLELALNFENTVQGHKPLAPGTNSLNVAYARHEAMRSLELVLLALSAIAGLFLLATRRLPRVSVFVMAILFLSFLPHWFGLWLMAYCNQVVWGLWLSLLLALAYKVSWKVGGWLRLRPATALLVIAVALSCTVLSAQARVNDANNVNNDEPVVIQAGSGDQPTIHRVYVPYNPDLLTPLPKTGEIFLPYERYLELWNKAYPNRPVEPLALDKRPEVIVYHASYQGKIEGKEVPFTATFLVHVHRAPAVVPLGLQGTAIQEASLQLENGTVQPLTLRPSDNGYSVIITDPGNYKLSLQLLPVAKVALKQGELALEVIPVASSSLQLALDADMEVYLPDFRGHWVERVAEAVKTVTLFPGSARKIAMKWYESSERHRAQGLNITTESAHTLDLHDNLLTLRSKLSYQIVSGSCTKLTLQTPKDYTLVQLKCTNLEQWILSPGTQYNEIVLRLLDTTQRNIVVELVAEKLLATLPGTEKFPEIIPLEVTRENGQATLVYHNAYKVFVTESKNVWKANSQESGEKFFETYRFNEHPYRLEFQVAWRLLNNFANSNLTVRISEEEILLNCQTEVEVKEAQIFEYQIVCPSGYEVTSVEGSRVKTWRIAPGDKEQRLFIGFATSIQQGEKVEVRLSLRKPWKEGDTIAIPYLASPQLSYQAGTLLILSVEDMEIAPEKIQGLEESDISQFADVSGYIKRYAFHFEGEPYQAVFQVHTRKAEWQVDTAINLLVEDDWLNFGYFLRYSIQFAGVDTLKFRLPCSVGENIELLGENIREIGRKRQKDDNDQKDYWIYTVSLHNKVRGIYHLALFPELKKNLGTGINIEPIHFPPNVQVRLCVLIQNNSQYVITPHKGEGMALIGADAAVFLPPATSAGDFILAYKMERLGWQLSFTEQRQKPELTIRASLVHTYLDTVVDEEGDCRHRILYQIKPGGLQFLELSGLQNVKIWGVFVGGYFIRPVKRSEEGKESILIPLYLSAPTQTEEVLSVRIIYSYKVTPVSQRGTISMAMPKIVNIQEVGKVTWRLVLPEGYLYKFGGNISMYPLHQEVYSSYGYNYPMENRISYVPKAPQADNLKSALTTGNKLQQRQNDWSLKERASQKEVWDTIQSRRQQKRQNVFQNINNINKKQQDQSLDEADINDLRKIEQYGMKNLQEAQRAGQDVADVYRDKKAEVMAGESDEKFLQRQAIRVEQMIEKEGQLRQQAISYFTYDLDMPATGLRFTGEKPGEAMLEIRCYTDPRTSRFWLTLQFLGFLALIFLSSLWKLFSRQDGYSLKKLGITLVFVAIAVFLGYLRLFVHYFYL